MIFNRSPCVFLRRFGHLQANDMPETIERATCRLGISPSYNRMFLEKGPGNRDLRLIDLSLARSQLAGLPMMCLLCEKHRTDKLGLSLG